VQTVSNSGAQESFIAKLSELIGISAEDVNVTAPLTDFGVDSLAAVELATWLKSELGIQTSQMEILGGVTIAQLLSRSSGDVQVSTKKKSAKSDKSERRKEKENAKLEKEKEKEKARKMKEKAKLQKEKEKAKLQKEKEKEKEKVKAQKVKEVKPVKPQTKALKSSKTSKSDMEVSLEKSLGSLVSSPAISKTPVLEIGSSSETGFKVKIAGATVISFSRPDSNNSLTAKMWESLLNVVKSASPNKPLVFATEDKRYFCSGFDLGTVAFGDRKFGEALVHYGELLDAIVSHPQPVLCICQGATRGGGMLFPCAADIVIAADNATFGFPEILHGGLPAVVSAAATKRLPRARCMYLMLTGKVISAYDGQSMGLVDSVVESEEIQKESSAIIRRLGIVTPELVALAKRRLPAYNVGDGLALAGELQDMIQGKVLFFSFSS